jgi:hypothetical protein
MSIRIWRSFQLFTDNTSCCMRNHAKRQHTKPICSRFMDVGFAAFDLKNAALDRTLILHGIERSIS